MSDHRIAGNVVQELTTKLHEASTLLEELRRKRYRKWTLDRVIVDVLVISGKPLNKWEITRAMEKGGYEFRAQTMEPERSVGVTLARLRNEGRVRKVSDGHGGEWPMDATWTATRG